MATQKIDKDQLLQTAVRVLSHEMNFDSAQSNQAMNILTTTFSDVDFTATEYMLSTDKCQNEIILSSRKFVVLH